MFSKVKRKPKHGNAEAVLSEDALNDSLRAAQVIFQRHSQQKPTSPEIRSKSINTKTPDTNNESILPRRSNTVKVATRESNNESDIVQVPRRPNTTKPARHLKIPTSQTQSPVSPNNYKNIGSPESKILSPTLRKTISPRESTEMLRRRNPPPNNNANIDAAYIAAALAHSYVKDSSNSDKQTKDTAVSGINDDDLIAKSIKQEVKRDATPPVVKFPQERMDLKQSRNFETNRRRMEVPQPVKKERIRPIQLLDDSLRTPEVSSTEEQHIRHGVSPYRPISPSGISLIKSKPTTPMTKTISDPLETQSNDVDYIPNDQNEFDGDRNSIGNHSFSDSTTSQQRYNDTESLNLDQQNFSIGTNILPRKKYSSKKNPLKKIFGKSSGENTSYNTISRNVDPLLVNNNLVNNTSGPGQADTPTAAAMAAAAKGPVYTVPNPKQKTNVYGSNNNGSTINTGSTSSLTAGAPQMRFKTTMRYDNRKKSFNEDKPWKSHKDAKFMSEQERKRYEGMWVSNRYRYLNMLYWWPVNDIQQEIEQDSGSESQSNNEEETKSLATTQYSQSRTASQIDLTKTDSHSTIKSRSVDGVMADTTNATANDLHAVNDIDQANLTIAEVPVGRNDTQMRTKEGDNEFGYIHSSNKDEQDSRMNATHSHDSNISNDLPSRPPSPVVNADTLPDIIRTSSPVPLAPPRPDENGSITPPDYSDILLTLPQDGLILNLVVKDIWQRSNLPDDLLRQIYQLVDTRGDSTLDRRSFLVGMWLVDQCLYGRKLPVEVDRQIWNSVDGYVLNVMQPRTEPTVKIKRRGKRNIVGRELSNIKKGIRHVHL
ncbi:Increased rDNA silencing protein [Maudiozyma exigua]|uniref:Increased rDNA silencing protein n=1 Tax=Maudiozyma exigua TaxID=34358 RepID=A0A9P7B9W7_MAUEX|nr:Increased rDNA silencing protein [Kazachstania exigua]